MLSTGAHFAQSHFGGKTQGIKSHYKRQNSGYLLPKGRVCD